MKGDLGRAIVDAVTDFTTLFYRATFQELSKLYPEETARIKPDFDEFMGVLAEVSTDGRMWSWAEIRARLPKNQWMELMESDVLEITRTEMDELVDQLRINAYARLLDKTTQH